MLGCRLVVERPQGRIAGRIVEVEAYIGEEDRASHARSGPTARNAVMYGDPGRAYLYLVYGMHVCLNVVTEPAGRPAAVLIRAVGLDEGVALGRELRVAREIAVARRRDDPTAVDRIEQRIVATPDARLAAGPGLVGAAFGLATTMNGQDLCDPGSPIRIERLDGAEGRRRAAVGAGWPIRATPRIGIAYAGAPWTERPWRLVLAGHPAVSGPAAMR